VRRPAGGLIAMGAVNKRSATQKAGCRGGQAVAGNRGGLRSGDAREGAATKGGYTLVTLPRTVTPYRGSVDGTRDHVPYQQLVTR